MLGLEKGKVYIAEYDENWNKSFEKEKERLTAIFEKAGMKAKIKHVGSTSIKGMKAKPIIDIAVGFNTKSEQFSGFGILKSEGLRFVSTVKQPGLLLMSKGDPTVFYYHLVVINSFAWRRLILFRDYLRSNPKLVSEYEILKVELAQEFEENRVLYAHGKQDFINAVLTRANYQWKRNHRAIALDRFKEILRENGVKV